MRALSLGFLIGVVGCSGETSSGPGGSSGPTSASVAGTWALQSINGSPVPITATSGDYVVDSGVVTLGANATAESKHYATYGAFSIFGRVTSQLSTSSGIFIISGTTVTFTWGATAVIRTGSFSGTTLTMIGPETFSNNNGNIWVLKRR